MPLARQPPAITTGPRPHGRTRRGLRRSPCSGRTGPSSNSARLLARCPSARLHARLVLQEWGLAALSEEMELLVSELVTNGLRASRAMGQAAVLMWLVSDLRQVVVFVWDASPLPPARADPGADAESGRGLLLVEALSDRWGHFGYDGGGKVVWAVATDPGALS